MGWYFAFFLVSGYCSLVYEVVWLRLAMARFGVTTPFVAIVLSVFMGGLALGSWSAGGLARRFASRTMVRPLRLYSLAELVIGISGLLVPGALIWGQDLLARIGSGVTWDSSSYYAASGGWIALTLLPACLCMGATFPLAMAALRKEFGDEAERAFSYLYLANVLGATSGTLIAAFVLIELLGFHGTLLLTAALNGSLAVAAFLRSHARPSAAVAAPGSPGDIAPVPPRGMRGSAILPGLFLTGLTSMAMEVVWIRQFTFYLGPVIYTFAAVLALYLAATALGSRIYRTWSRARERGQQPNVVMFAWMIVGMLSLLPLLTIDPRLPLRAWSVPEVVRILFGIAPFCGVVGFLTPMMVDRWSSGDPARAGAAYATNVLGSLLGPLLAAFWLLPALGERTALVLLACPLFAMGLISIIRPPLVAAAAAATAARQRAAMLFIGVVVASLPLTLMTIDWEEEVQPPNEIRRDHTATVIAATGWWGKVLVINGQTTAYQTPVTKMMAHLPLAFLDRPPRDAMVIAFGMGTTFRSLLSWEIRTTAVELVPSVPALFGHYHPNATQLLTSPLARVVIDDGRRFLDRSTDQYDVITIDPPPPAEAAGSSLLYSREFYSSVKKRLRPDGIVQQWLPPAEVTILASVARALRDSFPYVRAFHHQGLHRGHDEAGFYFLASLRPIAAASGAVLASRLPPSAVVDLLEWGPEPTAERQFSRLLARETRVETLIGLAPRVPAIQDDRPINEYYFLRRLVFRSGRQSGAKAEPTGAGGGT